MKLFSAGDNLGSQQTEILPKAISNNLIDNVNTLKQIFYYPNNEDIVFREIYINFMRKAAIIVFLDGMANKETVEKEIIKPLINSEIKYVDRVISINAFKSFFSLSKVTKLSGFNELKHSILQGDTVLLINGYNYAIALSTIGYEHRSVESTKNENVIKGPQESFIESVETNKSLIRKQLKTEKLISESITIGSTELVKISIMYMKDIANPELINKVKERVKGIKASGLIALAILEQYIEDKPYSLVPTVLYTERPDRASAFLEEGHVILLMDNSPSCLIVPVTFWSLFHTSEDQYQRWAYSNLIRVIRFGAIFIALFTPAIYIAMTNYHPEMIPMDLLLAIAATREKVPFPVIIEVLLMEGSFELVREAGVRVPSTIGPTIGIVGALILGQAAVEANIVSPILVIIVAITGLASFTIANTSLNYMIRISRLLFIAAAMTMGFLGIGILIIIFTAYLCSIKSFDVPFLSPMSPHYKSSNDTVFRKIALKQVLRPTNLYPMDKVKQKPSKES